MSDDERVREIIKLELGEELSRSRHDIEELKRHRDTYIYPTVKMLEDEHDNRQARNRGYKWAAATAITALGVLQAYGDKIKAFLFG